MKRSMMFLFLFLVLSVNTAGSNAPIQSVDLNLENQEIAVTFFDLTVGEAILVQDPIGGTVLINTGSSASEEELIDRLQMYQVKEIEEIWLTNADEAYSGNINSLLRYFNVKKIIAPERLVDSLIQEIPSQTKVGNLNVEEKVEIVEGASIDIIDISKAGVTTFMLSLGSQDLLFMGETNRELEEEIVASGRTAEVLKVANFGSDIGTTSQFLDAINPQMAVIFRHKKIDISEAILERLSENWTEVYYPYRIGSVTIRMQLDGYDVITIPTKTTPQGH
ncbi:ComEC/Rec2 family competence protein [Alkalihalobacillus sp. CinArs1]|uniref:ComEC/Rec2 family competence protein n=1 Tax=Alkalihalobacillus sp. CinArs1 TaxID=2995314 RepID=UPI0022DDFD1A|nr:hypothetical protein [Alkalihalobacillus sp. CinArs1]